MKCDVIAEGIMKAAKLVNLKVPLVCRLYGTNAKQGKALLDEFTKNNPNLTIITATDLDDAAKKAVSTCKSVKK